MLFTMKILGNLKHLKKCKSCGEEKTYDEFYRATSGKHGRNSRCKACKIVDQKKYDANVRKFGGLRTTGKASEWSIPGNIVYQFLKGGTVIYCGQTTGFYGRMSGHRVASSFYEKADELRYCEFPSRLSMHIAEAMLIAKLNPIYNEHVQDGECEFAYLPKIEWKFKIE